jgi:hypothetical protein
MNTGKILLLLFFVTCTVQLFGQHEFICGHEWVMHHQEAKFPGYTDRVNAVFRNALSHAQVHRHSNEILTIPVVVHIVHKNDAENLHDSLIENQISVLNESFRLRNTNKDEVRAIFKDLQADAGIEFVLKEVKRVKTSANFALSLNGLPDQVKRTANGGSDAVSPSTTLNIWVCRIQPIPLIGGQILGYAYPPAGLSNWPAGSEAPSMALEGVVIDFRAFSRNNPNVLEVNGKVHVAVGRTAVHEVGHYLGLRHIWGDGGGIFGGSSCNQDDGIEDTPNQGQQSGGVCNASQNTCTDASGDLPDMIENYMDYSAETCQNTFTEQQVGLMRAVLQNQRSGLLSSTEAFVLSDQHYKVYPNPTTSGIQIHAKDFSDNKLNYSIHDVTGKTVMSGSGVLHSGSMELDVHPLSAGIYFITLVNADEQYALKFIKLDGR